MSSIRIGVITYDSYGEPRARRLADAAVDGGYSVDFICSRQPGEMGYQVRNGVHIHRVPVKRSVRNFFPLTILDWCWFMLLAGITVTRLHLRHAYDVIHVHNMPDFLVFSTLIPKLLGAKIILDVQDVSPELMAVKTKPPLRGILRRLAIIQERLSIAFVDHVVTAGWPFEELLLQRGVPREKVTIIINSVDPKLFPSSRDSLPSSVLPDEKRPLILMYYGTLAKRSGVDVAMRAIALARRQAPHLRFHVKGIGQEKPSLMILAKELSISDIVEFSDGCPVDEIVNFIVQCDIGIIPYQCDGFTELLLPTKAYELAWLKHPMIVSDTIGIRSMFRPESVILCEPSNPESFSEAIINLYQHPEKRAQLIANAAQDYTPFKWELMAKRYQLLLASLSQKQTSKLYWSQKTGQGDELK